MLLEAALLLGATGCAADSPREHSPRLQAAAGRRRSSISVSGPVYFARTVGYVFDLPLTDPDFTDHIRTLIATEITPARRRNRLQPHPKASKPLIATARHHRTWVWG